MDIALSITFVNCFESDKSHVRSAPLMKVLTIVLFVLKCKRETMLIQNSFISATG